VTAGAAPDHPTEDRDILIGKAALFGSSKSGTPFEIAGWLM
jgi:hypothetical protein